MPSILCVDLGSTNCKLGFVAEVGGSVGQQSVVPSAPFLEPNGHAALCTHLKPFARGGRLSPPIGLALALPFEVDYRRNWIASNWRGGWPDSVLGVEASLMDELGLRCVVLNDAVAFALGCPPMRFDTGPQANLCLILGTYFGCAVLKSTGTVQPVEVDYCLPHYAWPSGALGSPTAVLNRHRQQNPDDAQAYGRLVGWLIGALQTKFGKLPVVLGGGHIKSVRIEDVTLGIQDAGGSDVDVRIETDYLAGLKGAAHLWREVIEGRRPIQEVVAARADTP
jgi:hypothetical protein